MEPRKAELCFGFSVKRAEAGAVLFETLKMLKTKCGMPLNASEQENSRYRLSFISLSAFL